jgi:hypothetical protein
MRFDRSGGPPSPAEFGGQSGLLAQEVPLRPDLSIAPEFLRRLRFVVARDEVRQAGCCVVANALVAHWCGGTVFYSRDNTFYAAVRAGVPSWFSRSAIVAAVEQLAAADYLEQRRTAPSPSARYRSRFRPTRRLVRAIGPTSVSDLLRAEAPPVILRGRDDRRVLDPSAVLHESDVAEFHRMSLDVEQHNAFLSGFGIRLHESVAQVLPTGLVRVAAIYLNPSVGKYHRVFNGDLQHGGRWYGPWWQGVPSSVRASLVINGEPTVELDYAACQLRLMFAHLGLPDPLHGQIRATDVDLYTTAGVARDQVKLALLIAINASSPDSARRALAAKLTAVPAEFRRIEATRILGAVQEHFAALKPLWCSGIGLRLQRVDSDVCGQIHRDMRAEGLPVLSIHDSFICWKRAEPQLRAIMQKAFAQVGQVGIQPKA